MPTGRRGLAIAVLVALAVGKSVVAKRHRTVGMGDERRANHHEREYHCGMSQRNVFIHAPVRV